MTIRFRLPSPERRERSASSETLPDDQSLGRPWVSIGIFGASHEDKVNFIQTVAGQENLSTSATDLVRAYDFLAEGIDFSLVEFPSFGDAHSVSDEDTFFGISNWFEKASLKGQYFHGLIYLYGIIDDRENGSESRNLRIFKELCGAENLKNSIVGFTRWDQEEDDMVEARKKALKEIPEFWGDLSNDILRVEQITSDRQKCMDMLSSFAKTNPMTLNIQKQIIVVQNPPDITSAVSMIKDYQRRHAIRDAEELEHATQQNYHQEKLRKLRQQALARAAEHEEKFNRLLESQNVELHELTMQNEKGLTDPNRYADIQARRLEGFQHLRLTMATQERDLKPELFKLDEQNVRRLEELDNAKLRRRAAAHKESLIQRRELLKRYDESLGPQQAFEYLDQKFDKRLRMDYEMRFCYHCLDQLSLFDSFWNCKKCKIEPGDIVSVCNFCRVAGKGCMQSDHQLQQWIVEGPTWCPESKNCFRTRGIRDVYCDHCRKPPGSLFLHCCSCKNDDFDLCIDCWGNEAATCLKPEEHGPLLAFGWAPPDERY